MSSLPVATCSLGSNLTALAISPCIGVENVVSHYIRSGSSVYGCFFYNTSIEFDLVNHFVLFHKLLEHGLPFCIVRFLLSWYSPQECHV